MNWRWLFLAFAALFVFGFSDNIRGPIYPELLSHFQISHVEGAWFFALVSLTSVVSSVLAPLLISKLGHINVLRLALFSMASSQVIFATVPRFDLILIGSIFYGAGAGALGVVQNVMVLLGSETRYHQKFQSALHSCYGAASLLAPLVVMAGAHLGLRWQSSFWFSALLILSLIAVSFVSRSNGENSLVQQFQAKASRKKMNLRSYWTLEECYFALILSLYVGLEVLIATRLASFLRAREAMDLQNSSLWVTLFFTGLLLGRLFFVLYQPKMTLRKQLLTSVGLVALGLCLGIVFWSPFIVLTGIFLAPFYPVMMTAVGRLFPQRIEENLALCNAFQGMTLVTVHGLTGFISDWGGMGAAMGFGILLSSVTILLLSLYPLVFKRVFG